MALPLKSGADLYNNQALRLRLHNLGADPTEVGAGLIYFNTSTGMNTSKKARIYTGDTWKTIAFSEDLDVASNADFLALKERVDLLSGDVDTDAIISNMKEVSEFLEGFNEDASLMDYLNTELGKKLDKTGGTITFSGLYGLTLARTSNKTNLIHFTGGDKDFGFLGFAGVGNPVYADYNGVSYALLHEGNYVDLIGDTYLKTTGGTIKGNYDVLTIQRSTNNPSLINFSNSEKTLGYIGVDNENLTPIFCPADLSATHTLLHSGNVGNYALKTDGSNDMKNGLRWEDTFLTADKSVRNSGLRLFHLIEGTISPTSSPYITTLSAISSYAGFQIGVHGGLNLATYFRKIDGDGNWSDWKTIAFMDSNVAGAYKLVHTDGASIIYNSGKTFYVGDSIYPTVSTNILGKEIALRYGASATNGLFLNESGNVTIGSQDYAGTSTKLYVDNTAGNNSLGLHVVGITSNSQAMGSRTGWTACIGRTTYGLLIGSKTDDGTSLLQVGDIDGTRVLNMSLNPFGGNVLIGTTTDNGSGAKLQMANNDDAVSQMSFTNNAMTGFVGVDEGGLFMFHNSNKGIRFHTYGAERMRITSGGNILIGTTTPLNETSKLQIKGDLYVEGNVIVTKEISGGGRAEEGGTIGGDGAEKVTATIEVGLKFKEISHTLGDNVIVQVYEWNANGQTWDMVLTDVETTTNLVTVRFGNETDVPHKVVII